ncbi:hypothetical protein WDV91_17490 [Curtobacterium flaccumfaciens pv. flaccumfaciens]
MAFQNVAGLGTRVWRWSRTSGTQPRLLHAGKAAAAAVIAWFVARHIPGVAAEYPYYAPLGAVVAMQTTVFAGIRSGVQTLVGIALGILIAAFTMWVGDPGFLAIALAVGVGVLVGGFRVLGEGSSWVSTAALFVLLVGGANAEGYSLGYLVQMAVGVVIGLLVNFLVFPPLHFWDAEHRIDAVNGVLADHLDGLAAVLEEGKRDEKAWDHQQDRLDRAIADVRSRVAIAHESRRLNPRGALRGSRARLQKDGGRFRALERVAWYTTDLTELVARSGPVSEGVGRPDPAFATPIAEALRKIASTIRGDSPGGPGRRGHRTTRERARRIAREPLARRGHLGRARRPARDRRVRATRHRRPRHPDRSVSVRPSARLSGYGRPPSGRPSAGREARITPATVVTWTRRSASRTPTARATCGCGWTSRTTGRRSPGGPGSPGSGPSRAPSRPHSPPCSPAGANHRCSPSPDAPTPGCTPPGRSRTWTCRQNSGQR